MSADGAARRAPRHAEPVSQAEAIVSQESVRLGASLLLDRLAAQCADELECSGDPADGCGNPPGCDLARDVAKFLAALAGPK